MDSERQNSPVEEEAYSAAETIRERRQYSLGVDFQLVTNQRSVAVMDDRHYRGKVKNDKIQRWRIFFYSFNVVYRRADNKLTDTLSRGYCASTTCKSLKDLLEFLSPWENALGISCYPGTSHSQ